MFSVFWKHYRDNIGVKLILEPIGNSLSSTKNKDKVCEFAAAIFIGLVIINSI